MNVKTTITLLDVCLKRHFIKFFFHFEGVLLTVRGCTSMFRGCSRTLKTPNSPPLRLAEAGEAGTRTQRQARPEPQIRQPSGSQDIGWHGGGKTASVNAQVVSEAYSAWL